MSDSVIKQTKGFTLGIIILCYLVLSVIFSSNFFTITNLGSHWNVVGGDAAQLAWTLAWVSRAITTDPLNLFNGNAFYPHQGSIALGDHMFSLAIINVVFRLFSNNPWVGYNLLIFLAYFLSCLGGFLLIRELTRSAGAAFWGGIFWGFLFFRVHHIMHLNILSYQWIPFLTLYLIRLLHSHNFKNALLFSLLFLLQALVSWYLAVIITFITFIVGVFCFDRKTFALHHITRYLMIAVLCALVIAPFTPPYFTSMKASSLSFRVKRAPIVGDQVAFRDYLTPPDATILGQLVPNNKYSMWGENSLYIGYVPLLLTVAYLVFFAAFGKTGRFQQHTEMVRQYVYASVALIVVGYVFAMGFRSTEWGIRLPLSYLFKLFSFLGLMRATQRFSLMIYAGILILSGIGLATLLTLIRRPVARVLAPVVLSACFLFEVYPFKLPLPFSAKHEYRYGEIDQFIAKHQQASGKTFAVLHYPIYYFIQRYPGSEAQYMIDSTLHWANIVNGVSGAVPAGFLDNMGTLNTIPSQKAIDLLKKWNIDLIAVHAQTPREAKEGIRNYFANSSEGQIIPINPQEFVVHLRS